MPTIEEARAKLAQMAAMKARAQQLQNPNPMIEKGSEAYNALPTTARSTASFLPGEIGRAGEAAYEGFKQLPGVKQFGQAVGGAVGALGGVVGGTVGAVGGAGEALATGKPVLPTMMKRAGEIGGETAKFGYGVGKEAAPAAIAGAGGKLIQAPMAAMQISSGIGKLQEGDIFGGLTDIGLGGLSGYGAVKEPGMLVSDSLKNLGEVTPKKALKLKGEAQDLMYEVIRPTAGEIRKYEVRQGKDLHEVAGFMAKEKMMPEVDSTKKLNWTNELDKQKKTLNQENRQLQGLLETNPGTTNLLDVRQRAHATIDQRFTNAKEAEDAKAVADELLNAEVSKYGTLTPPLKDSNKIKSGMWGVGYDATKPMKSRVARILGHEIATDVKGQAGREAQKILDTMGKRLDAISLMENSTGRIVKGGRLGTYVARLLGGMIGHATGLGPVGTLAGEHIGGVASEAAQKAGPIMAAKRAAGLMTKAEKAFSPMDASLARGPGAAGAEMIPKGLAASEGGFQGFTDLSTKTLEKLKGRTTVSKQFISDLTNAPDLKQAERDAIRNALQGEKDTVNVKEFADKVKTELLPLKRQTSEGEYDITDEIGAPRHGRYENITLPEDQRGNVENYSEHIYESPIKTSAGDVHFGGEGLNNYFAHTRVEDMADGKTRRVIEAQSDLFQKGRLEGEQPYKNQAWSNAYEQAISDGESKRSAERFANEHIIENRKKELSKLEPYRNTWHERIVREEVKQAAKDGKSTLQFPTGETAMKIEGLGENYSWSRPDTGQRLRPNELKTGMEIASVDEMTGIESSHMIITDVLGDGKFKAVPKNIFENYGAFKVVSDKTPAGKEIWLLKNPRTGGTESYPSQWRAEEAKSMREAEMESSTETFDISGKVDENNPIFKFYEKEMGKYLKNKYGATKVTDPQGVSWYQINVGKEKARLPVEAYGLAPLALTPLGAKSKGPQRDRKERK